MVMGRMPENLPTTTLKKNPHRLQDETSLAMHARIVEELERDPSLLRIAKGNIARWSERNADSPGLLACYREWDAILAKGLAEVIRVLKDESEEGDRLRHRSPFPGILTPQEVWQIKADMRARWKSMGW
jgi:hypothetical protein